MSVNGRTFNVGDDEHVDAVSGSSDGLIDSVLRQVRAAYLSGYTAALQQVADYMTGGGGNPEELAGMMQDTWTLIGEKAERMARSQIDAMEKAASGLREQRDAWQQSQG